MTPLTGIRFEAHLTPEQDEVAEEMLEATRMAWNAALDERQRAKRAREVVDYRSQRDDVLEDICIDHPDVLAPPLVEALKQLDKLCHATPRSIRVQHRSTRGRQSFTLPADEDAEFDRDNARVWVPDIGWTRPA